MIEMIRDLIFLTDGFEKYGGNVIPQQKASTEAGSTRSKVLVVDDQKLIVDTISEILESAGFDVAAAYDGWQALEAAARFKPDHLLTDVLMPRMNGVELAIAIRQNHPSINILLFSGQAGISEILFDAEKRGFHFEVIPKPIHPSKLIQRLREQS
jgi:CheY-like chemotaxis protein